MEKQVFTPQPAFLEVLMSNFLEPIFEKPVVFSARSTQLYSVSHLDG